MTPREPKPLKPKRCKNPACRCTFTPAFSSTQICCSLNCALALNEIHKSRRDREIARQERADTKRRKEKIKTIPQLIREAQVEFNHFCRTRDRLAGVCCVSCGGNLDWSGNGVDAGHYRSVGSASHLRFNEHNCHAQCKQCNRYGAGRAVDYRIGLIGRIGLAAVEALEADNTVKKWGRDELRAIRAHYREKRRELEKETA